MLGILKRKVPQNAVKGLNNHALFGTDWLD